MTAAVSVIAGLVDIEITIKISTGTRESLSWICPKRNGKGMKETLCMSGFVSLVCCDDAEWLKVEVGSPVQ